MNLTIEIPDDNAARYRKVAQAHGLTVDRWMLELADTAAAAEEPASTTTAPAKDIEQLFAPLRGVNLDFNRNPSTGRPVQL